MLKQALREHGGFTAHVLLGPLPSRTAAALSQPTPRHPATGRRITTVHAATNSGSRGPLRSPAREAVVEHAIECLLLRAGGPDDLTPEW